MVGDYGNRIDLIGGYQFARLDDSLRIFSNTNVAGPTTFHVRDKFDTTNEFHGGLIGLMGERSRGQARISWLTKLNIGNMRQQVNIAGGGDSNGVPLNGGLFAQQSNIGTYVRDRVAFLPEANLNVHYQFTNYLDLSMGYSIIYISSVALAGDQIDRSVNLSQQTGVLVGPARPAFAFHEQDYWFQGLNFGLNFTY